MTQLADIEIIDRCVVKHGLPMIEPFECEQIREISPDHIQDGEDGDVPLKRIRAISFGVCSYGYDLRLSPNSFRVFHNAFGTRLVDPKNFDERLLIEQPPTMDETGTWFVVPGNSYALAETVEYIRMPRDLTAISIGKSTYARVGLIANITPFEAGWEGVVTLELANACPAPVKVYANEGICQTVFFKGDVWPAVSYADRQGKYQRQQGLTTAKV